MAQLLQIFLIAGMSWLLAGTSLCCYAQQLNVKPGSDQPVFKVSRATSPIVIDGKLDEKEWQQTAARSFNYYYKAEKPTDKQQTKFRMLWDDKNLYVAFDCEDLYITARETARDGRPFLDDCGEIFLIPVPDSLNVHYGFELNLNKASNDFIYLNNFYQGKNAAVRSFDPEFEVEVTIDGTVNDNSDLDKGWTMEMAIPIKLFKGMDQFSPVKEGNKWAFLAIRQERNEVEGERRITSTIFPIYDFSKDVHQPYCFGHMEFVK